MYINLLLYVRDHRIYIVREIFPLHYFRDVAKENIREPFCNYVPPESAALVGDPGLVVESKGLVFLSFREQPILDLRAARGRNNITTLVYTAM